MKKSINLLPYFWTLFKSFNFLFTYTHNSKKRPAKNCIVSDAMRMSVLGIIQFPLWNNFQSKYVDGNNFVWKCQLLMWSFVNICDCSTITNSINSCWPSILGFPMSNLFSFCTKSLFFTLMVGKIISLLKAKQIKDVVHIRPIFIKRSLKTSVLSLGKKIRNVYKGSRQKVALPNKINYINIF